MKSLSVTIQMKATEQYFPVVMLVFQNFAMRLFSTLNLSTLYNQHLPERL